MKIRNLLFTILVLKSLASSASSIKNPYIHETNGSIRVMIIDTGVDSTNSIIRRYISNNENLDSDNYRDSNGHGTAVAGTVVYGALENKTGIVSVNDNELLCPEVQLYSCRYAYPSSNEKDDSISDVIKCYKEALAKHIDVINFSGGGYEYSKQEYFDILKLQHKGVPVIAAAGNDNLDISLNKYYPASLKLNPKIHNVYPVGSFNTFSEKSSFSNYGISMDWEYGENVLSFVPESTVFGMFSSNRIFYDFSEYVYFSGTSQATALYTHKLLLKKCNEIHKGKPWN